MKRTELAWIAGFYEGEGCISLRPSLRPRVSIVQKDDELLRWIQDYFGGKIYSVGTTRCPNLFFGNRYEIRKFLESILPYMRLEKRIAKAELAIVLAGNCTYEQRIPIAEEFRMV